MKLKGQKEKNDLKELLVKNIQIFGVLKLYWVKRNFCV